MSKAVIIFGLLLITTVASAQDPKFYDKGHAEITKTEALKRLINEPKVEIYKCVQVELTDKATFRNK